jgi:type 1 glutamine amidotransferase
LLVVVIAAGLAGPGLAAAPTGAPRVLVFTKTAGYRHASIPAAIAAVEGLGAAHGFAVDATEDASVFSDANLKQYAAAVFLLTSGDVLNADQEAAFERYIRAGGGWVGVHSAADTAYDWPFYGGLLGAYFKDHPAIQQATIDVAQPPGPGTVGLPAQWTRTDEWYNFQNNPRSAVHVLATLDEASYQGGEMGADHPIAWWHDYEGGRAWYTAGGHTEETWSEPLFLAHILGGIEYAIGRPRILTLKVVLQGRRATVTAAYAGCPRCNGSLLVGALTGRLHTNGSLASGTSPPLSAGHHRVFVILTDPATGVRLTASRPIIIH